VSGFNTDEQTASGRTVGFRSRPSMREVAEVAGVGVASVSRVLSGHPDVSGEMRRRVLVAVDRLGYEPNLLAQSLRRRETLAVGFLLSDIANPILSQIVKGAEAVLRDAGYSMVLTNSEGDSDLGVSHLRLLQRRRVDGLMLLTSEEDHPPTVELLSRLETPLVVIDRTFPESIDASYVLSDHEAAMNAGINHLLDLGHRHIGLIVGPPVRPSKERQRALHQVFQKRGSPETYEVCEGALSVEHGLEATKWLLDRPKPPSAIILGGNQLLVGALRMIHERGIELGRDLSLISSDDTPLAELHRPPVSVMARNVGQMGRVAAELLLRQMRDGDRPTRIVLPSEYIPRRSCGPAINLEASRCASQGPQEGCSR
jgi:LacI family transcriptional regulator